MFFVPRFVFVCFVVFLAGASFIPRTALAASYDLSGRVHITKVSDGDSLRSGTLRIRLFGIDAPELKQQCANQNGLGLWCRPQRQLNDLIGINKDL